MNDNFLRYCRHSNLLHFKTMGWFLAFFVMAVCVVCCSPKAFADTDAVSINVGDFIYSISSTSATLTSYKGSGGIVTIPATITDNGITYTVTAIGNNAFDGNVAITSVTIPNSVTSIGSRSFAECTKLSSIDFEDTEKLENIGDYAFLYCTSLKTITLPDSVSKIGISAFFYCQQLKVIDMPDSITKIENSTFCGCSSLTSIVLPESITSIGDGAFKFTSIRNITIPNSVTTIGNHVFEGCTYLEAITIPDGVATIGMNSFRNCTSLYTITIPDTVTTIEYEAFYCCSSLTSIDIPSDVSTIGGYAFYGCTSLKSILLPNGITSLYSVFSYCTALETITIPDSVTIINDAFSLCFSLTSVKFGADSKLNTIGNTTFYNCTKLTSVIIPSGVTTIGARAFDECTGLSSIVLPRSVTSIAQDAFANTSSEFVLYYHIHNSASWFSSTPYKTQPFCILTLNFLDGSKAQSSIAIVDSESRHLCSVPKEPSRTNYTFGGWYLDPAFTRVFDFGNDTVSDDLTLYAKWIPDVLKINKISLFDTSGKELDTIPSNADFKVHVSIDVPETANSSYYVILAFYGADGRFNGTYLSGPSTIDGQVINIGFDIKGKDHAGDKIKVIMIDGSDSYAPLTNSATL